MERRTFISSVGKCGLSLSLFSLFPSFLTSGHENKLPISPVDEPESIRHSCDEKMEFAEEWIQKFMNVLDENLDEPTRNKIMENNGKVCMTSYLKKSGHTINPVSFEQFSDWVSKNPSDGSVRIEGRTIHYAYLTNYQGKPVAEGSCLCPLVESKPAGLSKTYCRCSVGYVREYFTKVLGQPVKVELTESVLNGGKFCRFRIDV